MNYFIIKDKKTGNVWSRNKWGIPTSSPDLFQSEKRANYQITEGKIFLMLQLHTNEYEPEVVPVKLVEVKSHVEDI